MHDREYLIPIHWNDCSESDRTKILMRPKNKNQKNIYSQVADILDQVYQNGDQALIQFNTKFDHCKTTRLRVSYENIKNSKHHISYSTKKAIQIAMKNITQFHRAQNSTNKINLKTFSGTYCKQIIRPLNTIGLYVPGGVTPLPSTVMMLGIPANIAQCKRIILCSPPPINTVILYIAQLCGIKEIYQIGGCQAIAAMGFGTESIPKVNKIFGPGNIWVTEAKRQINYRSHGLVAIDMLAGPSEILIIADETANPTFIAADLLSQAEHGPDSHVLLITPDTHIAKQTKKEIHKQLQKLPRKSIILQSLYYGCIITVNNIMDCFYISNQYAPEHLILQIQNPSKYLKYVNNAGSIFLGHWSPESAGDYASGPNHVLPTYGHAKNTSGLGITDFQKRIPVQKLNQNGLLKLSTTIQKLANIEKLKAHEYAITHRINYIKEHNEHSSTG